MRDMINIGEKRRKPLFLYEFRGRET